MDKLKMHSLDVIGSNIEKIQQLFPNCVTERLGKDGKPELAIDFEKLQAELSNEIIGEGEERYQFTWPDKRAANRLANTPTTMTLRPCREESVDFDHTQNLYIEGDNLDVLKALRETYLGKVKMIYIDPPYNTGNDFVYNDDFAQSRDEFEETSGLFDEEGNQTIDPMQRNTESNGRFHTDWLNMIYPRLKVARDLLSDDGVIFISIDDNEVENLKKICNEILGESNFIAQINWKGRGGRQDSKYYAIIHEYILCFARNINNFVAGLEIKEGEIYPKYDTNKARYYKTQLLRKWGSNSRKEDRPNLYYPIIAPDGTEVYPKISDDILGCWRWGVNTMKQAIDEGRVEFVKQTDGSWIPYEKIFAPLDGESKTKKYVTWIDDVSNGTSVIKELFGIATFDYAKSPELLIRFLKMAKIENDNDIILDFFSGSATTAHAVMQLNAEDGGNRKFIMVQLPEKTDEKSEAYKAGYKNICEIGKERIRRAGKKILTNVLSGAGRADGTGYGVGIDNYEEYVKATGDKVLDIGFRVLKLDSSNMEEVYYTPQEFTQQSLFSENVKADRTGEDLLFQVMLDLGIELSAKIETRQIADKTVHLVDDNYLVACFDRDVTETAIKEIAELHPVYFVMRDASAANDNVIDNFEQIFRHYSPDTNCRII